jgi:hypothetical protein
MTTKPNGTNRARFEEWRALALVDNPTPWQADTIHGGKSRQDLIMHRGAVNGYFISVDPEGTVRVGAYAGAVQHITDATFYTAVTIKCKDYRDGLNRILSACDMTHLIGLFS